MESAQVRRLGRRASLPRHRRVSSRTGGDISRRLGLWRSSALGQPFRCAFARMPFRRFASREVLLYRPVSGIQEQHALLTPPHAVVPLQFGFTHGRQPMDAIEALRTTARKAKEWGHHLFIASLEVDKAFDQLEAYSVERAVLEHRPCCGKWWDRKHVQLWRVRVATLKSCWAKLPGKARLAPPPSAIMS